MKRNISLCDLAEVCGLKGKTCLQSLNLRWIVIEFSPLGPEDATPRPEPDFLDESRERLSVQAVMLMNIYFR